MQGMKSMTKKDILEIIEENFSDCRENDVVATFFFCSDGAHKKEQQCLLFRRELKNV